MVGGVEVGAEHLVDPGGAQRDPHRLDGGGVGVEHAVGGLPGGDLGEELPGAVGGHDGAVGVDAALEAGRRLRPQTEALGGAEDPVAGEVGRLQEQLGGGVGDLGVARSHHAGDGLGNAVGVADQEVGRREGPLHPVERGDLLALVGQADHDPPPAEEGRGRRRAGAGPAPASRSW